VTSSPSHALSAPDPLKRLRAHLRELYEGDTPRAHKFRYALLGFDLATVAFIVTTSFTPNWPGVKVLDILIGLAVLADFTARLSISRSRWRDLFRLTTWADIVALVSFLVAPIFGEGAGFLRILRTLGLLRNYQILARLRADSKFFCRNEEIILAIINLFVFIYVMTGIVYATQYRSNPGITNFVDALYFTVTSLTTTGYGDIILKGTVGRLISVVIMIFGVTLFLRLAQILFRPHKVRFPCPVCGLQRHDQDAVHCKACGTTLCIPDEGD
jgi:voltage-gated potassium channel